MSADAQHLHTPEEDVVRRTAALARLSIDADETRLLAGDFARILASFHVLAEVDLADGDAPRPPGGSDAGAPGAQGAPAAPGSRGARRADEPAPFAESALLLDGAPDPVPDDGGRFFGVPKTLGGPG